MPIFLIFRKFKNHIATFLLDQDPELAWELTWQKSPCWCFCTD